MFAKLSTFHHRVIILIFFFAVFDPSYQQSCNSQDRVSLLAFSVPLSISSSFPPLNWSSSISTCCSWEGVDCDVNGRVFGLRLRSRGLEGPISSSIRNLVSLTHLDLSRNLFHGSLPTRLFESLSSLEFVDLSFNHLDGDFSSSLSSKGGFPATIHAVDIASNYFHGVMESTMFLGASNLSSFNSSKNSFSGFIPPSICIHSPLLKALDFSYNSFSGVIPRDIGECSKLEAFSSRYNSLSGPIPSEIGNLIMLKKLDLESNDLSGSIPPSLMNCTNLVTILLLGYNFKGETLPSNRSFISSVGFPNLQFLSLMSSNLTGCFPEWISNMKNLRILQLGQNRITGTIPKWIRSLPKLFALELSNNLLTGEIPIELCLLPALVSANLSNLNHIYTDLPVFSIFPGRPTWDQFIVYPPQISLTNNRISGKIPSEIVNLQNLHKLYLNGNNLSGGIPVQISYLKNLEQLSLTQNHLSGEIPELLEGLSFLSVFNVSYNDLQGPIPTGGQFDTFQASSYEGNPGLCGEALQRHCTFEQNDQPNNNDEGDISHSFLHGLAVGFALGFAGILAFVASSFW